MPIQVTSLQDDYTLRTPVPSYAIPSTDIYPAGMVAQQLPYPGSAGPYGVPGNTSVGSSVPNSATNSAVDEAVSYGQAAAKSSPTQQPVFWAFVATMLAVVLFGFLAHGRIG